MTEQPTLPELKKEASIGGAGALRERAIPQIDLSSFETRREQLADELWEAAADTGFFQLVNHGIPQTLLDEAFSWSERFFALPEDEKARYPLRPGVNAGWEYMAQVRPSTGREDQKESYQITVPRMEALWPDLPGFKAAMLAFERVNWALGMRVLSCFAFKLGFAEDFFTEAHDPTQAGYQSTLRLLHYFPQRGPVDPGVWRAGAHTDFDCLTLLHQRPGEGGLQLCPGRESDELAWTEITPLPGVITCNIGDMLMRWSDDRLKSTLHRVRNPKPEEGVRSRYSLAFFCQANMDCLIESPEGRYPPISAHDYLQQRVAANRL